MSEYNYKRSSKKSNDPFLDSDDEGVSSKKKSKPQGVKRSGKTAVPPARASTSTPTPAADPSPAEWLFGSDDEDTDLRYKDDQRTVSVLSRRVPGGVVRRLARYDGSLVAEIRLFNADEVRGLEGIERCEKALLWLRLQGEPDSPEFAGLKKVVNLAKPKFQEEGTFFADKKKK